MRVRLLSFLWIPMDLSLGAALYGGDSTEHKDVKFKTSQSGVLGNQIMGVSKAINADYISYSKLATDE